MVLYCKSQNTNTHKATQFSNGSLNMCLNSHEHPMQVFLFNVPKCTRTHAYIKRVIISRKYDIKNINIIKQNKYVETVNLCTINIAPNKCHYFKIYCSTYLIYYTFLHIFDGYKYIRTECILHYRLQSHLYYHPTMFGLATGRLCCIRRHGRHVA